MRLWFRKGLDGEAWGELQPGPVCVLHLCPSSLGLGSPLGVTVP